MLPQSKTGQSTIYINPKFVNAHINPNFLQKVEPIKPNIYVNPKFIEKASAKASHERIDPPIIEKTMRKLVRQQIPSPKKAVISTHPIISPMLKIGKNKLIRTKILKELPIPKVETTKPPISPNFSKSIMSKYKIVRNKESMYKIDRRTLKTHENIKNLKNLRPAFISKYIINRIGINEALTPTKVVIKDRRLMRIGKPVVPSQTKLFTSKSNYQQYSKINTKLELLKINGVLYKSTKNKLQKTDKINDEIVPKANYTNTRLLIIKGKKFQLDRNGKSLRKIDTADDTFMKRIDIGGVTYIAKNNSTYERTNGHKTRTHLSNVKQKSINLLSKNLVKVNVVCPIFRRLGKCSSFARGRCNKIHDIKHVTICPKFLKGECSLENCLLSHNVTLSKMPTCKFYLQGFCTKVNCPYLHKKMNEKVEICNEFLRGFCQLADKCDKRHDFECPEFNNKGKCELKRCPYPHITAIKSATIEIPKQSDIADLVSQEENNKCKKNRYYLEEADSSDDISDVSVTEVDELSKTDIILDSAQLPNPINTHRRPKLGKLPSYIPII